MELNHRELAVFLSILRLGSINSAAQSLGMTQPALSRSLKRLETRLGVPLFVRHSQGMQPTRFGEVLRGYSEQLEFETERVVEEIRLLAGAATGLVRIGVVPSAAVSILPRALGRALSVSPGIQVRVMEGLGEQMMAAVMRGEVDFAVVGQPQELSDGSLLVTPLGEEEVCAAARSGHPLLARNNVTVAELAEWRWVLPEKGNVNRHGFRAMFQSAGLEPPKETMASNSAQALKAVLLSGDYLTMLTRSLFALEEAQGLIRALPMREARWRRRLAIVRRPSGQMLPATRLLLRELIADAEEAGAA
ncbi:DNA-binding transcriptional LysR family regulator [Amorphus suaedae]